MTDNKPLNLDEITIADNYMFVTVFSDPELCRQLLERVLGVEIERVVFATPEKTLFVDIESRSVRLDVYVRDEAGTVYDIEMQSSSQSGLLKRSRYYLSTIDSDCINKGESFKKLRKSFVIFVCAFDPFGEGVARYTLTPHCRETGVEYPDGATRLFVNAAAWNTCNDPGLRGFLEYLSRGTIEDDDFVSRVDAAVRRTRRLPEWRRQRMSFAAYIDDVRDEALAEGEARVMDQNAQLIEALRRDGRESLAADVLTDPDLRQRLLEEYGIVDSEDDASKGGSA